MPIPARDQHVEWPATPEAAGSPGGLGERLRARRGVAGISLRELARRAGVSASLVSQIENGKVRPSVRTLYALASELGASLDELTFGETARDVPQRSPDGAAPELAAITAALLAHPQIAPVQRATDRKTIQLSGGVEWGRLTSQTVPGVEFLHVVYEPGAESAPPEAFQRHAGREWGYVIAGVLHVEVGFDEHVLGPGDAITYASSVPHRLTNRTQEPVEAIWFTLG